MSEMMPLQEALRALDRDLPRSGLSKAAQLEYDRLKPVWTRGVPPDVTQPYLNAVAPLEPDSHAALPAVQQSEETHTFGFHRGTNAVVGIMIAGSFGGIVAYLAVGLSNTTASPPISVIIILAACTSLFLIPIWIGIRMPFMGVRIRGGQMTILNALRSYTINTSEIRAITLKPRYGAWVPKVQLTDGRSIWLTYVVDRNRRPAASQPGRELVEVVDKIRMRLGITAESSAD